MEGGWEGRLGLAGLVEDFGLYPQSSSKPRHHFKLRRRDMIGFVTLEVCSAWNVKNGQEWIKREFWEVSQEPLAISMRDQP